MKQTYTNISYICYVNILMASDYCLYDNKEEKDDTNKGGKFCHHRQEVIND